MVGYWRLWSIVLAKARLCRILERGGTAVLGLSCLLSTSCGKDTKAAAPAGGGVPVTVMEARAVPVNDASEYVATVRSRDSAVIMPQVEGQIVQIYVHSGDRVAAGSRLMQIDPLKQQATVTS